MKPFLLALSMFFLFSMLLAACGAIHFTPEAAAASAVLSSGDSNFQIDTESVKINQTLKLAEDSAVVVISFQGLRNNKRIERCIYSYRVVKNTMGWQSSNGGGGCQTRNPGDDLIPIEPGVNQSHTSQPDDPGFSQAYGAVNQPDIVKVRLTWDDNQVDEVEVVEATFVDARQGLFNLMRVEGLNDQGKVVYNFDMMLSTNKQE